MHLSNAPNGRGGIAILINKCFEPLSNLCIYPCNVLKIIVKCDWGKFFIFNIYDNPYSSIERANIWANCLKDENVDANWIIMGDFNMTTNPKHIFPLCDNLIMGREKKK